MGVDGALPKLDIFEIDYILSHGSLLILTTVLAGGAAPLLRRFHFNATACTQKDVISIADMVDARARISACPRFVGIGAEERRWLDRFPLETQI